MIVRVFDERVESAKSIRAYELISMLKQVVQVENVSLHQLLRSVSKYQSILLSTCALGESRLSVQARFVDSSSVLRNIESLDSVTLGVLVIPSDRGDTI